MADEDPETVVVRDAATVMIVRDSPSFTCRWSNVHEAGTSRSDRVARRDCSGYDTVDVEHGWVRL